MTHPLRMRVWMPLVAAVVAALLAPAAAPAAVNWTTTGEAPLDAAPFAPGNVGVTDSAGGDYAPSTTYEAISNPVTLPAGYSTCRLQYWRSVDLGAGDVFHINVLLGGQVKRTALPANHTAQFGSFVLNSQFDSGGQVQVQLKLTTNGSSQDDGVHMDDIRLYCHGSPNDSGYEFMDGTSMATPMVSGAAGLLFSQNPALSPADLKNTLLQTVDLDPGLPGVTVSGGRLDVYRALTGDVNPAGGGGEAAASGPDEGEGSSGATAAGPNDASVDADVVPGQVIVRYQPGSSVADRLDAREQTGTETIEGLGMARAQLLEITDGDSVGASVRQLENQPGVEYAEPNGILQPAAPPNDPLFLDWLQWGLFNFGQTVNGIDGTDGADISAVPAWEEEVGDPATVIAVMDSGADLAHPDLENNLWTNPGEVPGNGLDDDGNGFVDDVHGADFVDNDGDPTDLTGHGTHVSGIAAAEGDNGIGVTGVSQQAALMELRVCDVYSLGCTYADQVEAVDYAGDNGARILNGSLQGTQPSDALQDALERWPDVLYVFAAGNGGSDGVGDDNDVTPSYPCAIDEEGYSGGENVICVAATDQNDELADFSNYGSTSVDLGAPGVNILSTSAQRTFFADDFEGNDFDLKWGSSSGAASGGGDDSGQAGSGTTFSGSAGSRPNTFFKRKPGKVVRTAGKKARVVFRFGASKSGASFRCRLDTPVFVPCGQKLVRYLQPARHVLKVKAVDSDGAMDQTPAVAKFRVKRID